MYNSCKYCGRSTLNPNGICDKCRVSLCEICSNKLSRGYCAVCGRLICDDHSHMVGYARVCVECANKNENFLSYEYLKEYVFRLHLKGKKTELKRVFFLESDKLNDVVFGAIGLDDIDSPYGMCTTYLSAKILEKIENLVDFIDYPSLVRLNPNIPFKTRGNASVKIQFKVKKGLVDRIKKLALELVNETAHTFFPKTQPAVAFYFGNTKPSETQLKKIYYLALTDIVTPEEALKIAKVVENAVIEVFSGKNNSRGIVGALAALGSDFKEWTFELIAYRRENHIGKPRHIVAESVARMDSRFREYTFANLDGSRVLITPQGPDPVLFGIRGFNPNVLLEAARMIEGERPEIWVLFKSNQGTNAHVISLDCLSKARPYQSVKFVMEFVGSEERDTSIVIRGLNCDWEVFINVYKPHGYLRTISRLLAKGDILEVIGNVIERSDRSIELNLEELKIISLSPSIQLHNPICPKCGTTLKSKGKSSFKCKRCGYSIKRDKKIIILGERKELPTQKRLLPPVKSWRHLTKPLNFDTEKITRYDKPITPIFGYEL